MKNDISHFVGQSWEEKMEARRRLEVERTALIDQLSGLKTTEQELDKRISVLTKLEEWGASSEITVGKNDCSRIHSLQETTADRGLIDQSDGLFTSGGDPLLLRPMRTFVVRNDWASLVGDDAIGNEEVRLPYPHCAFEFVINGRPVIQMCLQPESGEIQAIAFVNIDGVWVGCEPKFSKKSPVLCLAWQQVLACCAMLDAEVAKAEEVKAPKKLNEKRGKMGRSPLMDFHVIDLCRRSAHGSAGRGSLQRKGVRLHFRRGH